MPDQATESTGVEGDEAPPDDKRPASANTWEHLLKRESLSLKEVLNLARGEDSTATVPAKGEDWGNQYYDLISAARAKRLIVVRDTSKPRFWIVYLDDLRRFASTADHHWEWLRKFCRRWEAARGVTLPKPKAVRQKADVEGGGSKKTKRKRDRLDEVELINRIKTVVAVAKNNWSDPKRYPSTRKMAKDLVTLEGDGKRFHGYKENQIRQILEHRYPPMIRRGLKGLYS